MRPILFLLSLTFSTTLLASECSEIKENDSTSEIMELQGLAACSMRASLYLFGLSRSHSKEIYKNFYECEGNDVIVNVERFRNRKITNLLVSEAEAKGSETLKGMEHKKLSNLQNFISQIENKNQLKCIKLNRLFPKADEVYFQCGNAKLKIKVTPYIKCTDSWKSL